MTYEYPTEEELQDITAWPIGFDGTGRALIDYIQEHWMPPDLVSVDESFERIYVELVTGGWSGNESIISALQENPMFWAMCWESSHRGGLFTFKIRRDMWSSQ